ncbi:hypothetical protein [Lentzea sp. NPDC003310]|uniref:hypothetical protein n=1 Tax=Lentzea sp. NPDC003310 TaxID=3154447 RepID=UPI0033AA07E6
MDAWAKRDMKLTSGGQWEPIDVLEGMDEAGGRDINSWLESQGWQDFLEVGNPEGGLLFIETWMRHRDDGPTQYLILIGGTHALSPYLVTESLVDLMDLLSRWAPAVQAAWVADAINELSRPHLSTYGLVEMIAGRASVGSTETAEILLRERREDQQIRARRRRERADSTKD